MKKFNLVVKVVEIKGTCPVYKVGAEFYIYEGYKLFSNIKLCLHSLASIMPYYTSLARGITPEELGIGKNSKSYVQCLDPYNYTNGGSVVFEISVYES